MNDEYGCEIRSNNQVIQNSSFIIFSMLPITEHLIWALNGILVILYTAVGNLHAIGVALSSIFFVASTPHEQKAWAAGSACLALAAALITPVPVPTFLLVMSISGWVGLYLEQYNRIAQRWNLIRGQALYSLAGLGFALYRTFGLGNAISNDTMMMQGAAYLNGLIGIAMYVIPIGFLAWLAQNIWAHPPTPATPEELINTVRTRGR